MADLIHSAFLTSIVLVNLINQAVPTGLSNTDTDLNAQITYKELSGTNYRIYQRRFGWETAYIFCSRCVGNFAVFETPEKANLVRDAIYSISHYSLDYDYGKRKEEFGLDRRYWFGLHDQKNREGVWKWIKNTRESPQVLFDPLIYPWYTNQPDHGDVGATNTREHCGGFWNPVYHLDSPPTRTEKHTFNDMKCDLKYYFICEKVDPLPYTGEEPSYCKTPTPEKFGRFISMRNSPNRNKSDTDS